MFIFTYCDLRLLKDFTFKVHYGKAKGKIYILKGLPDMADVSHKTMCGTVIEVDDKDFHQIITFLDAYYMCSSYKYNIINPTDMSIRKIIQVETLVGKLECYTWFINKENNKLMERVRRGRLSNGLG